MICEIPEDWEGEDKSMYPFCFEKSSWPKADNEMVEDVDDDGIYFSEEMRSMLQIYGGEEHPT
mgnify:CR=1 FL=1